MIFEPFCKIAAAPGCFEISLSPFCITFRSARLIVDELKGPPRCRSKTLASLMLFHALLQIVRIPHVVLIILHAAQDVHIAEAMRNCPTGHTLFTRSDLNKRNLVRKAVYDNCNGSSRLIRILNFEAHRRHDGGAEISFGDGVEE